MRRRLPPGPKPQQTRLLDRPRRPRRLRHGHQSPRRTNLGKRPPLVASSRVRGRHARSSPDTTPPGTGQPARHRAPKPHAPVGARPPRGAGAAKPHAPDHAPAPTPCRGGASGRRRQCMLRQDLHTPWQRWRRRRDHIAGARNLGPPSPARASLPPGTCRAGGRQLPARRAGGSLSIVRPGRNGTLTQGARIAILRTNPMQPRTPSCLAAPGRQNRQNLHTPWCGGASGRRSRRSLRQDLHTPWHRWRRRRDRIAGAPQSWSAGLGPSEPAARHLSRRWPAASGRTGWRQLIDRASTPQPDARTGRTNRDSPNQPYAASHSFVADRPGQTRRPILPIPWRGEPPARPGGVAGAGSAKTSIHRGAGGEAAGAATASAAPALPATHSPGPSGAARAREADRCRDRSDAMHPGTVQPAAGRSRGVVGPRRLQRRGGAPAGGAGCVRRRPAGMSPIAWANQPAIAGRLVVWGGRRRNDSFGQSECQSGRQALWTQTGYDRQARAARRSFPDDDH